MRQTKLQKILREQGRICGNCGTVLDAPDGICQECQMESDEVQSTSPQLPAQPSQPIMVEMKAKALTVLQTAQRLDLITWPKDKAFAWFSEQAKTRGIAPEYQERFTNATISLYLQSL